MCLWLICILFPITRTFFFGAQVVILLEIFPGSVFGKVYGISVMSAGAGSFIAKQSFSSCTKFCLCSLHSCCINYSDIFISVLFIQISSKEICLKITFTFTLFQIIMDDNKYQDIPSIMQKNVPEGTLFSKSYEGPNVRPLLYGPYTEASRKSLIIRSKEEFIYKRMTLTCDEVVFFSQNYHEILIYRQKLVAVQQSAE